METYGEDWRIEEKKKRTRVTGATGVSGARSGCDSAQVRHDLFPPQRTPVPTAPSCSVSLGSRVFFQVLPAHERHILIPHQAGGNISGPCVVYQFDPTYIYASNMEIRLHPLVNQA